MVEVIEIFFIQFFLFSLSSSSHILLTWIPMYRQDALLARYFPLEVWSSIGLSLHFYKSGNLESLENLVHSQYPREKTPFKR